MKKLMLVFICLIFIFNIYIQGKNDFPPLKGPYLGQKPPGMIPKVFATGIVSTDKVELNAVFSNGLSVM